MKVSDYIASFIESKGITHVFELSGGMITHLLDSFHQHTKVNIVTMHHEQSAAFAADAYGRATGLPGIALATSGPGAINLLTGIGSCYFDSSPAIFITGQVNRHEQKGIRKIRQLGFQETDIVSMANCITKKSYKVETADEIPFIMTEAFEIATSGRPGPVLIDIPMDIQRSSLDLSMLEDKGNEFFERNEDPEILTPLKSLIEDMQASKKPLILVGRGVNASFAKKHFHDFLTITKIPVVTSLLAIDVLNYDHPQRIGFIGSYGNRWANIALGECDLLIVLGSRLDIRQTGADVAFFGNRKIYHVDCDDNEVNNRVIGCVPIICDLKIFFSKFSNLVSGIYFENKSEWVSYINKLRDMWPDTMEVQQRNGINPNFFMHRLSKSSNKSHAYIVDVGSHQMWAAQSIEITGNQIFATSGGMGAMGFALPAAIGLTFSLNNKPVIAIIGDGSMQINIQELETIKRNKLPIKIIILNNQNLGMIRQFQDSYFNSRYHSTWWGYSAPDFARIAKAYEIDSKTIIDEKQIEDSLSWLWDEENLNKPLLLQVMIDPYTNTYPKIAFGRPLTEMEPIAKPIEIEST